MAGTDITIHPVHLGVGASSSIEPRFSGDMNWYSDYTERHLDDGDEGRLLSMHVFSESWDMWEMHPKGSEVVLCTDGAITLRQELADGTVATIELGPGQYAINEPGTWHTADVTSKATVVFITAGLGTQHRPR